MRKFSCTEKGSWEGVEESGLRDNKNYRKVHFSFGHSGPFSLLESIVAKNVFVIVRPNNNRTSHKQFYHSFVQAAKKSYELM